MLLLVFVSTLPMYAPAICVSTSASDFFFSLLTIFISTSALSLLSPAFDLFSLVEVVISTSSSALSLSSRTGSFLSSSPAMGLVSPPSNSSLTSFPVLDLLSTSMSSRAFDFFSLLSVVIPAFTVSLSPRIGTSLASDLLSVFISTSALSMLPPTALSLSFPIGYLLSSSLLMGFISLLSNSLLTSFSKLLLQSIFLFNFDL